MYQIYAKLMQNISKVLEQFWEGKMYSYKSYEHIYIYNINNITYIYNKTQKVWTRDLETYLWWLCKISFTVNNF